jgi:ribonuclease Z
MNPFYVIILGNGSAVPTSFQNPTSQLVAYGKKRFLIDCGEGTQIQMIKYKTGHSNINNIFISHLHGDHFFGLIGLLNTFHLYGRKTALNIYAPRELKKVIEIQLEASKSNLNYTLFFHFLEEIKNRPLYEDNHISIEHFSLKHRIPTYGFVFREKIGQRKLMKSFVEEYNPSVEKMYAVKEGLDYELEDGRIIPNAEITLDPPPPRSYAFCSDTAYTEEILPFIKNVDLLYHESTFDNSQENMAADKFHSTAAQAATIAQKATVKKLLLGHFSARFKEKNHLLQEAKAVFSNTELSVEGRSYDI